MSRGSLILLTACVVFCFACFQSAAQKKKTPQKPATTQKQSAPKPAASKEPVDEKLPKDSTGSAVDNEKKVRDIVAFLEYLLNTLGSSSTSTRDKEVVIRESYAKIFRDDQVQIEDDLESREVVTNKNVVAYLKDVDFFFTDVRFEFNIDNIQGGGMEDNRQFYKVSLQRNLKGTTLEGEQVNNTGPRFIEVNYDPDTDGLAIASIYTKGFDETAALTGWWNDLSFEWKNIFQKKLKLGADSVAFHEIQRVVAIDSLDLSNNLYIRTLEPLARLPHLRYLNLSATAVTDLTSIRNLTELTDLSVTGTAVIDLSPMKYAASIRKLNASHTGITSVEALQKMPILQSLNLDNSMVSDLSYLSALHELEYLSVAGTQVVDIAPIGKLRKLARLDVSRTAVDDITALSEAHQLTALSIDSTRVRDLRPLAGASSLKELTANHSRIYDLEPLKALPMLERIYCDQTQIVRSAADAFMASRPTVLVIYDSRDLKTWWEALTPDWQKVFFAGDAPTKDDLARLTNLDSINLSPFPLLNTLEPLRKVPKLRVLVASGTAIQDLAPIRDLVQITTLDVSSTGISDVAPLRFWKKLSVLRANNTKIQNIEPLTSVESLQRLYLDDTGIHDLHAREFLARRPAVLLVYKSYHVQRWWSRLPESWKKVFQEMVKTPEPGIEDLHKLVEMKSVSVTDMPLSELGSLAEFVQLESLHFSGTSVIDLSPLTTHVGLKSLHATNAPLKDLAPIARMTSLEDLDISGTPVGDLRQISTLVNLKRFNCAGTEVRKLDPLEHMPNLEFLDCSNTSVGKLDPVAHLPLKTVKCFNSRVSKREVEKWKQRGVEVVFY